MVVRIRGVIVDDICFTVLVVFIYHQSHKSGTAVVCLCTFVIRCKQNMGMNNEVTKI